MSKQIYITTIKKIIKDKSELTTQYLLLWDNIFKIIEIFSFSFGVPDKDFSSNLSSSLSNNVIFTLHKKETKKHKTIYIIKIENNFKKIFINY